jgi:hypothetical protein
MMGAGSTCTLTPVYSTRVSVAIRGYVTDAAGAATAFLQVRFGTGAAPSNGNLLSPGTAVGSNVLATVGSANFDVPFNIGGLVTGLTPGTAYWFDFSISTGAGTIVAPVNVACTLIEL